VKRRQPNPWFELGTIYRRAVDVLRTATEPLTARENAERVIGGGRYKETGKAALADLIGIINSSLRNHEGVGGLNDGSPGR
jgi:hypothetical protein